MQLVREHSATVVSARWAPVDWPGLKNGISVRELISIFFFFFKVQVGNELSNILPKFSHARKKTHHHHYKSWHEGTENALTLSQIGVVPALAAFTCYKTIKKASGHSLILTFFNVDMFLFFPRLLILFQGIWKVQRIIWYI